MNNKRVYKALSDLATSLYEIIDSYNNDDEFSPILRACDKDYPFDNSLDEVYYKVLYWTEVIKKRMDVLNNWTGVYDKLMDSADDNETRMKILDMVRKQLEEDDKYPCIGADEE